MELLLNHGAEANGIGRWHDLDNDIGGLLCIYFAVAYPDIFCLGEVERVLRISRRVCSLHHRKGVAAQCYSHLSRPREI